MQHNHHNNENSVLHSVCIVDLHVTVNNINYCVLHKNAFMVNLMPAKNKKKHAYIIMWSTRYILSDFNQNWSSLTDFCKSAQYKIPQKSIQLEPRLYMRTDREMYRQKDMAKVYTTMWTSKRNKNQKTVLKVTKYFFSYHFESK